jgi:hypothetical protein
MYNVLYIYSKNKLTVKLQIRETYQVILLMEIYIVGASGGVLLKLDKRTHITDEHIVGGENMIW